MLESAKTEYLTDIIQQLVVLHGEVECDQFGVLQASEFAFSRARQLLVDSASMAKRSDQSIPRGCASTDAQGGVRIEWVRSRGSVHLIVPAVPDGESYIYHEVGEEYATQAATPQALAHWLSEIG